MSTIGSCSYLVKNININLLKTVGTAELIDLMMNLIINPSFIIVHTIVEKCLVHIFFTETVNDLKKELPMNISYKTWNLRD